MAVYGALTIGRVVLTEDWVMTEKTQQGQRAVTVTQQEVSAVLASQAAARDRAEQLLAYDGAVVPVTWTAQPHRNGWYRVSNPGADEQTWNDQTVINWRCDLVRVGRDSEVEVESRLIGGNRTKASSATAELWHAPAGGHDSYYVGTSTPGFVDRVGEDGTVRVYRSIPAATNPRWSVPAASYMVGEASITVNGVLRSGLTCEDTPASWRLSNGILRVEPRTSTGTLLMSSYLTSAWGTPKVFDLKRGTTSLGAASHVTILRNDPCQVMIRLTWNHAPGRTTCDLSLTRGARHVNVYVQQYEASQALRVDDTAGTGTVSNNLTASGYIERTDADGDGNRWCLGTNVAATAAGTFGFAQSSATTGLAAFIGCVRAGGSAASGDTAANVNSQWLGEPGQTERVIAR